MLTEREAIKLGIVTYPPPKPEDVNYWKEVAYPGKGGI